MTTLNRSLSPNRNQPATGGPTPKSQTAIYTVNGRYTAVDTLAPGKTRHAGRPGGYTDVDTIISPTTDSALRPGSYIDIDARSVRVPVLGRQGKYTDVASRDR